MTTPRNTEPNSARDSTVERLRPQRRFVKHDVPLGVRAVQALDIAIVVAFANPLMRLVIQFAVVTLLVIVVTTQARSAVDELWFSVVVIVLVILPLIAIMWQ